MIRIPYGKADFADLIQRGFFYQDRTQYIEKLEQQNSDYPMFLRPRRFGKSLFINMLHCYYGVEHAALFQKTFGHLYIGQHPTPLANKFFILSFNFFTSVRGNVWTFTPPNYVIRKLYFDYFTALTLGPSGSSLVYDIQQAVQELIYEGQMQPFAEIVGTALQKAHSTRDKIRYGEKHLKTLMIGLLFPFETYLIRSEYETEGVFPDIFLERIPQVDI